MIKDLRPGDPVSVGQYRLLGRLGAGGMGQVFLAKSPGGRLVAIKLIRPELAEERGFRERFAAEIDAARNVSGIFTAAVVDADADGELPWMATVFVPGPSLTDAVEEHGALPEQTVFALAAGLAEALEAIHRAGLVHRDLKPSNVLLAADGPRVIDFGISRALERSMMTTTGMVLGSPGFMSPEQAMGQPVGKPSDVFSLGTILAYAATGGGPFGVGPTPALLYRVVNESADLTNAPQRIRPLIENCLVKEPADRPTPAELLAALSDDVDVLTGEWLPPSIAQGMGRYAPKTVSTPLPPHLREPGSSPGRSGSVPPVPGAVAGAAGVAAAAVAAAAAGEGHGHPQAGQGQGGQGQGGQGQSVPPGTELAAPVGSGTELASPPPGAAVPPTVAEGGGMADTSLVTNRSAATGAGERSPDGVPTRPGAGFAAGAAGAGVAGAAGAAAAGSGGAGTPPSMTPYNGPGHEPPSRMRRWRWPAAAAAAVVVIAVAVSLVLTRSSDAGPGGAPPSPTATAKTSRPAPSASHAPPTPTRQQGGGSTPTQTYTNTTTPSYTPTYSSTPTTSPTPTSTPTTTTTPTSSTPTSTATATTAPTTGATASAPAANSSP